MGQESVVKNRWVVVLESMLDDREVPPGNWWSVAREALAMLGQARKPIADYTERLKAETERARADPAESVEDRWWAKCN